MARLEDLFRREVYPETKGLFASQLDAKRIALQTVPAQHAFHTHHAGTGSGKASRKTRLHIRGNFLDQGELVTAAVPNACSGN